MTRAVRSPLSRPLALRRRRRTARRYRQRPKAATGFPEPSPRGPPPANRRDRRPARNAQPGRNARIAPLERGDRHRRGRRPGHRQRLNAAAGFSMPPPRGPPPANHRDRRPARNIRPERNARIAQLEHGGRHRRGRRPVTASARTLPAVFHSRRRAGRRPRTVATAAPRGTPSQGAMHALRGSTSAAATVAAPALATAGAQTPPPIFPRSRRGWAGPLLRARRPIAEHPARCAARAAHDHRWRPPPSRPPPTHRPASHSVLDPPCALAPSHRLPNPRTGAGFPHIHRSPRFIRFPQPTPLWKSARGRRSCDVDPSRRRSGPVDMWKTCVA